MGRERGAGKVAVGEPNQGSVAVRFQLGVDALDCNQRRSSVKNLKTVSGALTWRSITRTFTGCGQADSSSDSASRSSRPRPYLLQHAGQRAERRPVGLVKAPGAVAQPRL